MHPNLCVKTHLESCDLPLVVRLRFMQCAKPSLFLDCVLKEMRISSGGYRMSLVISEGFFGLK